MTILRFIRLVLARKWLLLFFPAALALTVFFLTKKSKREYASNTLIYTGLASGYTLESGEGARIDYATVTNAFDNLINTVKARTTLEEVGIRLLASHMMLRQPTPGVANDETYQHIRELIPAEVIRQVVDYNSQSQTVENIYKYSQLPKNVIAEKLLNAKEEPYSVQGIAQKLTVAREGSSDMVKITYIANDPAVVKQTLELVSSVFMRRYREMKVSETGNVVAYFEEQLRRVGEKLAGSEGRLQEFSSQNNIINFNEQTRNVAAQDRDISQEIQNEQKELQASKAALKELESRLSIRQDLALENQTVNSVRDSLAVLNARMALLEMQPDVNQETIRRLQGQIGSLEQRARNGISALYEMHNNKSGVPNRLLFDEWVQAFVGVDKSEARLLVLSDIKQNFDRNYKKMAPLGSSLGRIEREISVAEKEYLDIIHGLSQSKLREQNLMLSTNLKVIDPPRYPDRPEPSKRLILVIGAFMVGFILIISYIIAKEYFDWTLRSPSRAENQVGVPFVGGLPVLTKKEASYYDKLIEDRTLNQGVSKIKHWAAGITGRPAVVLLFSVKESTGKSHFAGRLLKKLNESGNRALWLTPDGSSEPGRENVFPYKWRPDLDSLLSIQEMLPNDEWKHARFVLVELPALITSPMLVQWVQQADYSLLVADAARGWDHSDRNALQTYQENTSRPVGLLLNRIQPDHLEEVIGEVPRPRSSFRRWMKRLLVRTSAVKLGKESAQVASLSPDSPAALSTPPAVPVVPVVPSAAAKKSQQGPSGHKKVRRARSAQEPSKWIVGVLLLLTLVGSGAYLWWKTAADSQHQTFWAYWFSGKKAALFSQTIEDVDTSSDSIGIYNPAEDDTLPMLAEASASEPTDNWDAPAPSTEEPREVPAPSQSVAPVAPAPAPPRETQYFVLGGTFNSRESARPRQTELLNGGYRAEIQEAGGTFQVLTGPYDNYKAAQDKAESIGFILEIKTSIIKK
ncbi:hypothetical protein GCM10027275_52400 [Rhabdobacter roseus]|uniref:Uncharacterized protein involved in exopolysaccharide biosynthesis/cell division septation protein DedD n=1 Tax=Rhabdobacter roseus TaxID=1655419 RepID=A0A840TWK6_9BACT|nr:SPOR domain-containing protein [Rhabdobacter roseus]MBB5287315.1 uncharacterized protein involved in exopolysaccharide biosynthesis/cell division septation protein DedD [Rhabdobacter roseus]